MSIGKSIQTPQTRMRMLNITLTTTGTPAVSGPDKNQVSSVVDNGVGDVTIIFRKPFIYAPVCEVSPQGTTQQFAQVKAKDVDRVTINIFAKPQISAAAAALATAAAADATIAAADATIAANVQAAFTSLAALATGLALSTSVGCVAADGVVDLQIVGKDDKFYR